MRVAAFAALLLLGSSCSRAPTGANENAQSLQVIRIWPGQPPGTESWTGAEQEADAELPNLGKVHVITNITVPTLTMFKPKAGQANGTAMVVVPGGAFRALPWDLDGLETAHWLVAHGITAFVLKYRVRPPSGAPADRTFDDFVRRTGPARKIAVADAEQSVRLIRTRARQFEIAPHKIGMIGFSAGAMTTIDAALDSEASGRPDFAASLYGALLTQRAPSKDAPPLFIAAAQDDPELPAAKDAEIFNSWTNAGRPAELHLYERGGHGFGFRAHHTTSDQWPVAFQAWLSSRGLLGQGKDQRGAGSR